MKLLLFPFGQVMNLFGVRISQSDREPNVFFFLAYSIYILFCLVCISIAKCCCSDITADSLSALSEDSTSWYLFKGYCKKFKYVVVFGFVLLCMTSLVFYCSVILKVSDAFSYFVCGTVLLNADQALYCIRLQQILEWCAPTSLIQSLEPIGTEM